MAWLECCIILALQFYMLTACRGINLKKKMQVNQLKTPPFFFVHSLYMHKLLQVQQGKYPGAPQQPPFQASELLSQCSSGPVGLGDSLHDTEPFEHDSEGEGEILGFINHHGAAQGLWQAMPKQSGTIGAV